MDNWYSAYHRVASSVNNAPAFTPSFTGSTFSFYSPIAPTRSAMCHGRSMALFSLLLKQDIFTCVSLEVRSQRRIPVKRRSLGDSPQISPTLNRTLRSSDQTKESVAGTNLRESHDRTGRSPGGLRPASAAAAAVPWWPPKTLPAVTLGSSQAFPA